MECAYFRIFYHAIIIALMVLPPLSLVHHHQDELAINEKQILYLLSARNKYANNITTTEEDKCITLLFSFLDSSDNLVVAIGSTTQYTLKYEDVVSSLLYEEIRRKSMDGHITDALFVRGRT
jgi:hypothetical protein